MQVREARLLRQLSAVMRQASAAGGFFDSWMKQNSDLVQATAQAYAGKRKHMQVWLLVRPVRVH